VLLRRDYSQYEVCPLGETHDDGRKEKPQTTQQEPKSKGGINPTIDVMVLFSNQAAAATSNMQALAQGSIQSSNDSFSNSAAGVSFNLVHYQQVSYSESGSVATDHGRLLGTSDGYMDNIHSLRDQYGADVVVLVVSNDLSYCGTSGNIGVGSSQAFAVTVDDCAIGNYTFAHEIGHLAGARHDTDPNTSPYAYGHGFRYDPGYWRTVMAVYDSQVNRIPYWSNPDKYYGGIAMGSTSRKDNARVWDERAATMAAFRTPPTPAPVPPSITMDASGFNPKLNWNPVSGASSYKIYRGTIQGAPNTVNCNLVQDYWNFASTSSTNYTDHNVMIDPTKNILACYYVTSNNTNGESIPSNKVGTFGMAPLKEVAGNLGTTPVKEVEGTHLPKLYNLEQNYPNPFNPTTQISYTLPEAAEVTITVYNIMGQQVATLVNTSMSAGFHELNFDAGSLSSGMYLARMQAIGQSGEVFSKELKMQLVK